MDIDALHSALISLTLIPEEIRSARENVAAGGCDSLAGLGEFLESLERDLRMAKATLARELGMPVCQCCWPPEILPSSFNEDSHCHTAAPAAGAPQARQSEVKLDSFTRAQKERLLQLRDAMVDSISSTASDSRSRFEGKAGALAPPDPVDAGTDAIEQEFALQLLSQEHDALNEIDQALKRIKAGVYGICEISGRPIPRERLKAIPFARHTVECQAQLERERQPARARAISLPVFSWESGAEDEEVSADATLEVINSSVE